MVRRKKKDGMVTGDVSVIDLLLCDHQYFKKCLEVLMGKQVSKKKKLSIALNFLDVIQKHSLAEKVAVYAPLATNEELHFTVLEVQLKHGIMARKISSLKQRLKGVSALEIEMEADLKALAEVLMNHFMEEELEMFPKMEEFVDGATLVEMGEAFIRLRKLDFAEDADSPGLESELSHWRQFILIKRDKNAGTGNSFPG